MFEEGDEIEGGDGRGEEGEVSEKEKMETYDAKILGEVGVWSSRINEFG